MPLFFILFSLGCTQQVITTNPTCTLDLGLEVTEVYAGELITVTGGPFTSLYDTRAHIRGVDSELSELNRTDCAICDACQEEAECNGCLSCLDCEASCETCVQSIVVRVPDISAGTANLILLNAYGSSQPLPLLILHSDTAAADTANPIFGDTGDSAGTNNASIRRDDSPESDHLCVEEKSYCQNQTTLVQGQNSFFWTMLSTVVDRWRLVMY
jgi:hypothetical protein